jgi:glycosyltransferase involved in cell wall biosynthesis
MNILYLTLSSSINSIKEKGIHTDLMREFSKKGHNIYIVSPVERRLNLYTQLVNDENIKLLKVKTLNLQKTNLIEKGIGTILVEYQFYRAIKKYFPDVKFDLILYTTPPVTFTTIVKNIKQKQGASSYLLLKDIFPQNAVDLEIFGKKSLLYYFFRKKEKKLYAISDFIGCMSPANVEYLKKHNIEIPIEKIEVCPNSLEIIENSISIQTKNECRQKYGIPIESTVFVYGGNLGKPQGLNFLCEILQSNNDKKDRFFIIAGSGTEYNKINKWFIENQFSNAKIIPILPKKDYDELIQACDVGMIFLDKRFTIPNYPSRLLSYLEHKLPILAATDTHTDIGRIAGKNNYGFWCENGDLDKFNNLLEVYISDKQLIRKMGNTGYNYLKENYTVSKSYKTIMKHFI